MADLRTELHRAREIARRRPKLDPQAPVPPPLPPGRTVAVPGRGELFVRHVDGPEGSLPVLLLHGWMWTADLNWWPVYEPLSATHTVVGVDHRDHGRSMRTEDAFTLEAAADDHAALLDLLGIPQVIVCGYSMGGPVAMLLAERHPEKVAGLVLAATTLEFTSGSWLAKARWRLLPLLSGIVRVGAFEWIVARHLRWNAEADPDFAPHRSWAAGEWRRQAARDIVVAGEAMAGFDRRDRTAALASPPSAVVIPTRDQLVEPWRQRALAEALGSEVVELDGDHFANLEAPTALAAAIVDAVGRVAARLGG
ncbi:MAG: alpha/beta fold hydrolase [Acidimicrobiales bacterium]